MNYKTEIYHVSTDTDSIYSNPSATVSEDTDMFEPDYDLIDLVYHMTPETQEAIKDMNLEYHSTFCTQHRCMGEHCDCCPLKDKQNYNKFITYITTEYKT